MLVEYLRSAAADEVDLFSSWLDMTDIDHCFLVGGSQPTLIGLIGGMPKCCLTKTLPYTIIGNFDDVFASLS